MKSGVPPEPPGFPEPSSETRVCESVPARRENSHQAVVERWPPADPGSRPWGHLRSAPSIRGGLTCSMGARGHSGDGAGGRAGLSMALGLTLPVFQGGCHSFTRQDAPGPGSPWERLTGGRTLLPTHRPRGPLSCWLAGGLSRRITQGQMAGHFRPRFFRPVLCRG